MRYTETILLMWWHQCLKGNVLEKRTRINDFEKGGKKRRVNFSHGLLHLSCGTPEPCDTR